MKKQRLIHCILFMLFFGCTFPLRGFGQTNTGIKFKTGLNWEQVQAQAKAENKYIFVDCFATWCGPCKMMDANVFPQKEVGDFFNEHFINIKVQMDQTPQDEAEVKGWYSKAKELATTYQIHAYPSYMIFNPNGKAVHYFVGTRSVKEFIAKANEAFDPEKQYYTLMDHWKEHAADSTYLLRALSAAVENHNDQNAKAIDIAYVKNLKNPFTSYNLIAISKLTASSETAGFILFIKNEQKVDSVMKKPGATASIIAPIIYREDIKPQLAEAGTKVIWGKLQAGLKRKYPTLQIWKALSVDSAFLIYILAPAQQSADKENIKIISEAYLKRIRNPLKKDNIQQIISFTQSTNDAGFLLIMNNLQGVDRIMGQNYAEKKLSTIVLNETIHPRFLQNDNIIDYNKILTDLQHNYPSLRTVLINMLSEDFDANIWKKVVNLMIQNTVVPDWDKIAAQLQIRFPGYDYHLPLLQSQIEYYSGKQLWAECERYMYEMLKNHNQKLVSEGYMNYYSWGYVFMHAIRKETLLEAAKGMKLYIEKEPNARHIDTYANLLYKAGEISEALIWENKAVIEAQKYNSMELNDYNITLEKMKKGEPTWTVKS